MGRVYAEHLRDAIAQCSGPHAEANAKLFAAAPDLLRALEMCLDDIYLQCGIGDRGVDASTRLARDSAKAAIDKATS